MLTVADARGHTLWLVAPQDAEIAYSSSVELTEATPEEAEAAAAEFEASATQFAIPLSTIVYGLVPEGFRQFTPSDGAPPELRAGESYVVNVVGNGFGRLEFTFSDVRA